MISFGPSEEQQVVREAMREFAEQVLRPVAREADEESALPDGILDQVWELGLTNTQLPEAFGGGGEARSPITNALILEELAFGDPALAIASTHPSAVAFAINDFGTEEQKEAHLPRFCGDRFAPASLALIEPSPTFDATALQTTVEPKEGGFVLSGRKSFVVLGDRAELFLVLARNAQSAETGFSAVDAFLVPSDTPGLTVSELELNLGMKGLPTVSLDLAQVEVPEEARLGGDRGIDAGRLLAGTRTANAALLTGLCRAVMEYAIPYAKDRHAFGEAIAQKQAIAFMLSNMQIETNSMRWLTWKAAAALESLEDATRPALFAHGYSAEQGMKLADDGLQVLGGHGFIREHPVEMWYRTARTLTVLEGVAAV
jgi:alkylation response protein AidB-like acyl-CoA dehydrogenase